MKKETKKKDLIRKEKVELLEKDEFLLELSKAIVEAEKIKQEYVEKGLCPYCSKKIEQKDKKEFCSDDHKTNYYGKGKPKKYRSSNESPDFASIVTHQLSVLREGIKKFELPDFENHEEKSDHFFYIAFMEKTCGGERPLEEIEEEEGPLTPESYLIEKELERLTRTVVPGKRLGIYELIKLSAIKTEILSVNNLAKKEAIRRKEEAKFTEQARIDRARIRREERERIERKNIEQRRLKREQKEKEKEPVVDYRARLRVVNGGG